MARVARPPSLCRSRAQELVSFGYVHVFFLACARVLAMYRITANGRFGVLDFYFY
ncbi:hypothetical protein DM02DRAFT_615575 [Periconia macrospinosa]|uniref:Uncharacterized protein n=1 Tax=Periconia macrospinosa TaxID=97972 RepID=A0A2V1DKK9_9PLEO|nr:hypothetical protein DM02DRAFT_615575 [Periconia macrospinosa]